MSPVFSHGRLRLYLLKLLAEGPKHGYELIRLLENRFLGLYAPSAGTIYPRLQRMEAEGLITHTAAGGRKTYEITDAGRDELRRRADELAELEGEIHASVADLSVLAGEIEQQVSGSVKDIKRELRDAATQARTSARPAWQRPETWLRPEAWLGWETPGAESPRPSPGTAGASGASANGGTAEAADDGAHQESVRALEEAVGALAAEVTRRARRAGVSDSELRAATAVVVSALTELRRLLR
jgi:DNA-binding PadR family transcriptional regulator